MEDFGFGGNDLPPYTINLFSPLLNLTHDHGPTEFCVGTSHTTGLLSGNYPVFDSSLVEKPDDFSGNTPFEETWRFHRSFMKEGRGEEDDDGPLPCPARNLRSVLLNVGDVVLFDYQIIHRAGHNRSPDSRAQIYLAYARKWFRDLNYHRGDKRMMRTRYASGVDHSIFEEDDDEEEEDEDPTDTIESIRGLLRQGKAPRAELTREIEFHITNKDLEEGTTVTISNGGGNDEGAVTKPLIAPGGNQLIYGRVGGTITLNGPDGTFLKQWTIPLDIYQLAVSKEIVGLATAPTCTPPEASKTTTTSEA